MAAVEGCRNGIGMVLKTIWGFPMGVRIPHPPPKQQVNHMSKSFRKTPIFAIAICPSEKKDKQLWHRRFRRAAHQSPNAGEDHHYREFSNPWGMSKDGKRYWANAAPSDYRK